MNLRLLQLISRLLRSDTKPYNEDADNRQRPYATLPSGVMTSRRPSAAFPASVITSQRPSAALRLLMALCCILLCALSRNAWFTTTVLAVELLRTALKPSESIAQILRPTAIAALFAAIFTIPAVFLGSPGSFGTIVMKVTESVLVLSLMNEEIPWKETTQALHFFHLPDVFIFVLDSTIRYLVILGRFSQQMLEAISLRRVGTKKWSNAGTGGILGTTFLKTRQYSQLTTEAMLCRGFTGNYAGRKNNRKTPANLAYCLLFPVLIVGFWYTQSLV